ncbi:MAG TPA: hypothetical protein VFV79_06765, partial [Saprospiraceae bacterium]|nr:hypothetical protein [Saprospiraceae bacterium]
AGYKLLPEDGEMIDKRLGRQALIYTCMLLPVIGIGFSNHLVSLPGTIGLMLISGYFIFRAWRFYAAFDKASAKALMFSSFIFLPVALMLLWWGM